MHILAAGKGKTLLHFGTAMFDGPSQKVAALKATRRPGLAEPIEAVNDTNLGYESQTCSELARLSPGNARYPNAHK